MRGARQLIPTVATMAHQINISSNIEKSCVMNVAHDNIAHRTRNQSAKTLQVKTQELDLELRKKRKRLQSVRARNALRNSSRERLKKAPSSVSSTSDDSIDVNYAIKRRRASNLYKHDDIWNQSSDANNNGPTTDIERLQLTFENYETEKPTKDRLKDFELSDSSQYIGCEDLTENADLLLIQEKSESNSSSNKFDKDDEGSATTGRTFQCPLCVSKNFRQINVLIRHVLRGHNLDLNDNDLNNLKYLILYKQNEISITVSPPQFSRPFTLDRPKPKRRYKHKFPGAPIIPNGSQSEEQENQRISTNSKARSDGSFTCLKCDLNFGNEQEFYDHVKHDHIWTEEEILRLRENGAETEPILSFWCPECSNAFVTKSALCMHLKANHDFLDDIELYLEKIGYDGEIPMAENQCNICYSVAEGPKEFEKHVRSHGLAFLRRQQLLFKLRTFN